VPSKEGDVSTTDQSDIRAESALGEHPAGMPSGVTNHLSVFDRFAGHASRVASRAPFFAFCVLLVVVWAPSYFALRDVDTWQLIINTVTTIVTFLLVALLQNSQFRTDEATQHKLNALAEGLANLMEHTAGLMEATGHANDSDLRHDVSELRQAVGLEDRESS
jgi:low affinity Fe/Cu permease